MSLLVYRTGAALTLFALGSAAVAQTYIGNGQALRVEGRLANAANAEIASSIAGPQPPAGDAFVVEPQVRAGTVSMLGLNAPNLVSGMSNFLSVDASALTAASKGEAGQVFSSASVAAVGVDEPNTNLTLGLSVPAIALSQPAISLSSFLSVRAVRTETFAAVSGLRTSRTIIEGLSVQNGNGGFVSVSSALLGTGTSGTTALDGTANLEFDESDAPAAFSVFVSGFGNTSQIASITLHEKLLNGDGSRTTNGIHVTLESGALTGSLLGGEVVIASSTAGVAAPEPGSFGLLALALGGIATRTRRRRTRAGIMHSKP